VHGADDRLATMAVAGLAGGLLLAPATLLRPPSRVWPLVALSGLVEARLRAVLRPGALVGAGVVAAYLLVLLAFQRADAGRVATLREVSVLLAVAWSGARRDAATWAGAVLVVAGAVAAAA
jgi:uncharacterized membrane protein